MGWLCVSRCPTAFPSVGLDVEARHQLDTCSESGGRQAKVGGLVVLIMPDYKYEES